MSEISEKARAEAERVEAEEAETGQDESPEQEEAPAEPEPQEPEPVVDEALLAARDRALTQEDKRHQTALGKAFGDEWPEHVRCGLCDGIGFLPPELARGLTAAQWEQVVETAVSLTVIEYVQDPNYETCPTCHGLAKTFSGAKPPNDPLKMCDGCGGQGYVQKVAQIKPIPVPDPSTWGNKGEYAIVQQYGSPAPNDEWGRPGGHPHYGIPPAAVTG